MGFQNPYFILNYSLGYDHCQRWGWDVVESEIEGLENMGARWDQRVEKIIDLKKKTRNKRVIQGIGASWGIGGWARGYFWCHKPMFYLNYIQFVIKFIRVCPLVIHGISQGEGEIERRKGLLEL